MIDVGTSITAGAFNTDGRNARDLVDEAERRVFEIAEAGSRGRSGLVKVSNILSTVVDRIDHLYRNPNELRGVPSGYSALDQLTGGLQRGDLIIIAGRPSMGKTTLAVNIAENAALGHKIASAIFSMEMSAEQVTLRMISSLGRIDQSSLRTGRLAEEDWPRIDTAMTQLSQAPIFIDETPSLTPDRVARSCATPEARTQSRPGRSGLPAAHAGARNQGKSCHGNLRDLARAQGARA